MPPDLARLGSRREGSRPVEEVVRDGDIDVDAFVSDRLSPDNVDRGFELMEARDGIRSVIG